jgi:hydroxymethylpyrimidine/phosphomethylpyrimidine kinase
MAAQSPLPRVLTIAGSDSGGGAGIQADLKTFSALNVYGMSAITAVTAQNTVAVTAVHELPVETVAAQIDAVAEDIGIDAAKTGMLSSAAIVETVASAVERHAIAPLVVDPVMVAKSGDALLAEEAREALVQRLLPLAAWVTPNIPEAEALTGESISTENDMKHAAEAIAQFGSAHVLIKGGHLTGNALVDILFDGKVMHRLESTRIDTPNTHGTGCTYAAAIAAYLAKGLLPLEALHQAKAYLTGAIAHSLDLGQGYGPLDHGWQRDKS